jgi:phage/plasmid-associated DNA primase
MLRGARLVTAQETEEGRSWAESRIKALTGGDPITARFMRQDFSLFTPQFKLFIIGNHRPGLRNVDEASRRRFHLVPFEVQIPRTRDGVHGSRRCGIRKDMLDTTYRIVPQQDQRVSVEMVRPKCLVP